jgi:SAM-dependent methyltransferase
MQRVGRIDEPDVAREYDAIGLRCRRTLERLLPDDWSWEGKRVLDFGCGAGRTLRHFLDEAEQAEFYGCDIDHPSVNWLAEHLSPPLHVFKSEELPPLPQPDGFFDLVYAISVFTHLARNWAPWLFELHRVLKPDGLLLATFLTQRHWSIFCDGAWNEDRFGLLSIKTWNPWSDGRPIVFQSEWWLREHWGRAFEVLSFDRGEGTDGIGQASTLFRRRFVRLTTDDLERPSADPRELVGLQENIAQLHRESEQLFDELTKVTESHEELGRRLRVLEGESEELRAQLASIARSRSWRLTAPLRAATAVFRRQAD